MQRVAARDVLIFDAVAGEHARGPIELLGAVVGAEGVAQVEAAGVAQLDERGLGVRFELL